MIVQDLAHPTNGKYVDVEGFGAANGDGGTTECRASTIFHKQRYGERTRVLSPQEGEKCTQEDREEESGGVGAGGSHAATLRNIEIARGNAVPT